MAEPPEQPRFVVAGNALTLLDTGRRRLRALIELIDGAERSLRLLYYIYEDDAAGRTVGDALVRAAARGVVVSLIVDGLGSEAAARGGFFDRLGEQGVRICRFVPRFGRKYLLRNHQKLALADEVRVIIGGFNIKADYFGTPGEDGEAWRDLGLLVEGPAAARLAGYYDALERWTRRPKARVRALNRLLRSWSEHEGRVRWLLGGPTRRLSPWARVVRYELKRARDVGLIAAYFAPGPAMLRRLSRAARRGGRVRIVLPSITDNYMSIWAARFTYAGLLRRGAAIYEYQPTKLHTKLAVIDDVVHIGSANFDMRSLFLNLEMMLRIDDAAFAAHVRAYLDGEVAASQQVTEGVHRARTTPWRRISQAAAYFVMAVLDPTVSRTLPFWGEPEN
ncbi:phospholipase D-like domain-containing protein [Sphingomonas baiyangensis]|uniref:Phospholipase D n=1 Tax=Sphingomonas baiyangensis TaxID=2572576 RepID=A0A4U1L8B8_9SPHN|nr:phosphatidylserine/phosphatidylglycerophosphate/cardiolipin synthase family protein [Sphingomonas baiyangensis]TKD53211.1 phosphatidylserine/phosphatidylglycerophosphate/cardiolipin synthase family protein [Sphingomonas baiyangensis]